MISDRVKIRINYMNYDRLSKLAYWLINRYWQKKESELAHYIITYHYHFGRGNGRNVIMTAILDIINKAKEQ